MLNRSFLSVLDDALDKVLVNFGRDSSALLISDTLRLYLLEASQPCVQGTGGPGGL